MRIAAVLLLCTHAWAGRCEDIANLKIKAVSIDKAEVITSGTFGQSNGLPPFCRVAMTARPSKDSDIKIELWLPEKQWNGRLEGTGNGGFAGKISYSGLAAGLKRGYAVANTDMGMSTPAGSDASAFVKRPERWKDWGYRATHEMTVAAKQVVKAYYNEPLKHSYFSGCSTGGEQALMEAEKFPNDYDGIVGGAPAHNRTGVHMSVLWNFAVTEKDGAAYLPAAKVLLLSKAVVAACDELDGVKDGVISNPAQCPFDPAALQCAGPDSAACLSAAQLNAVRKVYQGPRNPRTGRQIYPGLTKGSEFGWDRLGASPETAPEPPYAPIFKWVFGPEWDWRSFDFDRSVEVFESHLAGTLNAASTNLDRFSKHGGKLLLYHGWADWLVAPGETIHYYSSVSTPNSVRLFMLPGVSHCSGGPGADQFDPLGAVVRWVEEKRPPDQLPAVKLLNGTVAFRRVLCPYPQISKADGPDGSSYTCVNPK